MGFFSKIFRRSGKASGGVGKATAAAGKAGAINEPGKGGRKGNGSGRSKSSDSKAPTDRDSPTEQINGTAHDDAVAIGGLNNIGSHNYGGGTNSVSASNNANHGNNIPPSLMSRRGVKGPDLSDGSQRVDLRPPQRETKTSNTIEGVGQINTDTNERRRFHTGPVDLDDEPSTPEPDKQHRLLYGSRQHDDHDQHQSSSSPRSPKSPSQQARKPPIFMMDDSNIRFSAGQMHEESDAESSSFNLSTDAEDTDYENLKKRGVLPPLDTSNLSALSKLDGESTYQTDGERSIFPNLHTDDEQTATTDRDSLTEGVHNYHARLGHQAAPYLTISKPSNDSSENSNGIGSWNSNGGRPNIPSSNAYAPAPTNGFQNGSSTFNGPLNPTIATGNNTAGATLPRRNFTSPKKPKNTSGFEDFANFADFSNVSFNAEPSWNGNPTTAPLQAHPNKHFDAPPGTSPMPNIQQQRNMMSDNLASANLTSTPAAAMLPSQQPRQLVTANSSSSNVMHTTSDTSLSELLAQAKSKSSRSNRRSGASVNSAPATSNYLLSSRPSRSSLDRYNNYHPHHHEHHHGGGGGSGTSVTDIIQSLEAANASRSGKNSSNLSLNNSMNSAGRSHNRIKSNGDLDTLSLHSRDNVSVRSAKERLRRRRDHRRHAHGSESSDSDDHGSESWLHDEVTGALGPKGIAPDLESLSGRSNRSRSSGGGRSHKSHRSHRSHRSHNGRRPGSHRRHKSSSGDSVSSHGSRRSHSSRRSRSSRYSHRSTRSYISQMSEQSRSVANDLLRLEMQLAMVGSSPNAAGGADAASVGSRHSGHHHIHNHHSYRSSRSHYGSASGRSHRGASAARRTRITVLAPPGKLGIILANKADSKGTVVSGVRTSSVMAEKISPGDRIVAIDGEDVSLMTVSEITTIMARKSDFERTLTVLTTPRTHVVEPPSPTPVSGPLSCVPSSVQPQQGLGSPISSVGGEFDYSRGFR